MTGVLHSSMQSLAPFLQFLAHQDASFLILKEVILDYQPTLWGLTSMKDFFPWDYSKKIPEETKFSSPSIHGYSLAPLFSPHPILISTTSWSLQPRIPPVFTSPTRPSLFVNMKSRSTPFLVGYFTAGNRMLSSVLSRNVLDCLCFSGGFQSSEIPPQ